jgi:hypothetical protein
MRKKPNNARINLIIGDGSMIVLNFPIIAIISAIAPITNAAVTRFVSTRKRKKSVIWYPSFYSVLRRKEKLSLTNGLTVCVTCGWAGVDKTLRAGFCSGVDKARKWRRIPPVKCTLCWAVFDFT